MFVLYNAESIHALTAELTFPPLLDELAVQEFNVSITDDTMIELTEQVEILLNVSQEGVQINSEAEVATIIITNDDSKYKLE